MTARARLVAGVLVVVFGAGLLVLALVAIVRSNDADVPVAASLRDALTRATPAQAPFTGLTETRVQAGDRCLRVAIADDETERADGLRGNTADLGPYDGMLFVSPADSSSAFTMSGVTDPLDIAWFGADGTRSDSARMVPCADSLEECPHYKPDESWRFALETPGGEMVGGNLTACS
jgi:uncharacterized membrane protein (UPF0127 family)